MAVLAHPDDESLGVGGTLAKYAVEGADVFLLTATRGDRGRFRGYPLDDDQHPGPSALADIREAELRAAASALGVREVSILNYHPNRCRSATGHRGTDRTQGRFGAAPDGPTARIGTADFEDYLVFTCNVIKN
jgi:LmbE family N-acetylglucosaminyl deacetylase